MYKQWNNNKIVQSVVLKRTDLLIVYAVDKHFCSMSVFLYTRVYLNIKYIVAWKKINPYRNHKRL